jgi:orotidine-5'-phosphate decarboxylase
MAKWPGRAAKKGPLRHDQRESDVVVGEEVMTFGRRLSAALQDRGRLCVGIDPHPYLLDKWGLPDDSGGVRQFCDVVVNALGASTAIFKPQSAFFERHGSRGIAVLEDLIGQLRDVGALTLLDVKRGDIGSTMQAYADAYLNPKSPLCADAITASPFLGFGSLRPAVDTALEHGKGVFVLALTSNAEGVEVQQTRTDDGKTVASVILDHVRDVNAGAEPLGSIGCVVGANIEPPKENLNVNGPLLAPGVGAQGAAASDLERVFGAALRNVIPSVSRSVLDAGPDPEALQQAAASAPA